MHGVISFHPLDPRFFESLVEPLLAGEKVNPETFVEAACRVRRSCRIARAYKLGLERLLEELDSPPPLAEGSLWERVRSRLERFDYRVPALAHLASTKVDPDLHLQGRPFLVAEGSAARVAEVVAKYAEAEREETVEALVREQLSRLDPGLARGLEPEPLFELTRDATYRSRLLQELKQIYEHAVAAREESLRELPWKVIYLHSRAVPFWVARDVDGLRPMCEAAGIDPPPCLQPAAALFGGVCRHLPALYEHLHPEMREPRDLGAYVAAEALDELISFLGGYGSRIIRAASRHGDGARCTEVLRKIRECVQFAEHHGVGYLEAAGIHPVLESPEETPEAATALA